MVTNEEKYNELLKKFKEEVSKELHGETPKTTASREYHEFKKTMMPPHMTLYEKACNYSESLIKMKPSQQTSEELEEAIRITHLNITPTGVVSFSILGPLVLSLVGILLSAVLPMIFGSEPSLFFIVLFIALGIVLYFPLSKIPSYLANNWRMKASNQMVLCVFYVVTYMRHTSNLELAIDFAAEHLPPPLSLDLKKLMWDVETQKYNSLKEGLDAYLLTWKKTNMEFIESFHLIESSSYESSEEHRLATLEKALSVILEQTYEKMLHYAQNLKNPITMLHMMGIILPILGLVILPLMVSFLGGVKWYHIAVIYNVLLPIGVFYLGKNILSTRPTGYGDSEISDENPEMQKYKKVNVKILGMELNISPLYLSILVGVVLLIIGLSPLIIHVVNPDFDITVGDFKMLEYKPSNANPNQIVGPFGLGASVLSLFVTLAVGVSIGLYFNLKSKNIIKIRQETKQLEQEFASALFQLGNRLGDNLPAEIAFGRVAEVMEGTTTGKFFYLVQMNITRLGMSVDRAIYDPKVGALIYFPSNLIDSSMKVLVESAKKGPLVASAALMSVSEYIKEMHRVDERLKDLLSDIISSMKSQISFLTPVIAGIVVGITSMITGILGKLQTQLSAMSAETGTASGRITTLFNGDTIPTYYFQVIVGIYVVQIVYILTVLTNGVENGADKLSEEYLIGSNMIKTTVLYCIITLIVMILFNYIAISIVATTIKAG